MHWEGIDLLEDDLHELEEVFAHMHGDKEASKLSKEHFQRIQRTYNKLSNKKKDAVASIDCLELEIQYLSSTAYRSLQQFVAQHTLCDYTHVMSVNSGVCIEMIKRLIKAGY